AGGAARGDRARGRAARGLQDLLRRSGRGAHRGVFSRATGGDEDGMKVFAGALIALGAIFVLGGLLLPSRVHIERSRMLSAAPQAIYPLLANLRDGWPKWSPFGKAHDPDLKETFSGPESGAGATESLSGGSMPAG